MIFNALNEANDKRPETKTITRIEVLSLFPRMRPSNAKSDDTPVKKENTSRSRIVNFPSSAESVVLAIGILSLTFLFLFQK